MSRKWFLSRIRTGCGWLFAPACPAASAREPPNRKATANLTEAMEAFRECLERRGESLADCMGREHGS